MKKSILITSCFFPFFLYAQNIQWQNTIGGDSLDYLNSIQQTADGGYICGGWSNSNISGDKTENSMGLIDYWVIKLDSSGNIQWENTIGGGNDDELYSIAQTTDGGYICGGYSFSDISGDKTENSLGSNDFWIVKLDASGNIQWQNTIGGNFHDYLFTIAQTTDGGYICGGWSHSNISGDKTENSMGVSDYWVVKLDTSGNIQWQNTIGGNSSDVLRYISSTTDGGYICGGYSTSGISGDKTENNLGNYDYWVVKLDTSGNIQWQNTIGGSNTDYLFSIAQITDGGFVCAGTSYSNISGDKTENNRDTTMVTCDYWVVKLDVSGNIQWQNTIGGSSSDILRSVSSTTDGGYICGGYSISDISGDKTENSLGLVDYWAIKLDSSGNIQWQNTIGGNNTDFFYAIRETIDGGYVLGGYSNSNISSDKTENSNGNHDYWVIKINDTTITTSISNLQPPASIFQIFPNPAKDEFTVSSNQNAGQVELKKNMLIIIFDLFGREIFQSQIPNPQSQIKLDISSFAPGVYVIEINSGNKIYRNKVVKE